jgi:replicative DNA helicase
METNNLNITPEFEEELDLQQLLPPHSITAEQAVIGGLLVSNERWDDVSTLINSSDFYHNDHRHIFRALELLVESDKPIDIVTVSSKLDSLNLLTTIGGLPYLAELAHNTPSAANIRAYAEQVQEKSISRKLLLAASNLERVTRNPEGRESRDIIEEAERALQQIAENRAKEGGPQEIKPILKSTIDQIEKLVKNKGQLSGISSGFTDLDKLTNGLQKSDLIIVAARPAMGKTSFAMNLVEAAITKTDSPKPVMVFSMEMSAEQLMMRLVSAVGRIDSKDIKLGDLKDSDWQKLSTATNRLIDKPLYIDDTPALTPTEVRSRVRRVAREHGEVGLIMIDYLQLMQVAGRSEGRTAEISEISRSLKSLAKEFNCPVIALSQLNRSLENRPNKRPQMSDLRESGAIEQDADIIMFIYRDEVYNENSEQKGIAEIIIGKHRSGPTDTVKLAFIGRYTRFENLAPEYYQG